MTVDHSEHKVDTKIALILVEIIVIYLFVFLLLKPTTSVYFSGIHLF